MSKYIIDILKEEYKDFPITLDGEVLLEVSKDNTGNFAGYITTTVENVLKIKDLTEEELKNCGWNKYKHILNTFDAV